MSVEASPTAPGTGEPDEVLVSNVLVSNVDPAFSAGTYGPLDESLDILRQGTLEVDSDGCLILEDYSGIHPVLFPRGTFVEEDGTIHVPGEFVIRPEGREDEHGQPIQYQVGSTISGGGPEVSATQARNGIENIVLPEGCYDAAEASFYLLVP
ncbi:hypothetical protein ABDK96_16320 [Citricoccus nitrophenolicus]|uniref:Allene oxide cyclase barrel-like domain-containing protein n=1 Tax=Citricoccus nitrophenolicus TaxID=863575 RepID=A0ABV0INQ5_9MICC